MPYATPSAADFKARYPEFTAVPDVTVTAVIADAEGEVGATWIDQDRRPAVLALSAHWLAGQGYQHAQNGEGGSAVPVAGPLRSSKVGDVDESYGAAGKAPGAPGGKDAAASDLSATAYGQRFMALRRRSFPSAMVV
jgi:hypothetical protein